MGFFELLMQTLPRFASSLAVTVQITAISIACALVLGLISCLFFISHNIVLNWISRIYIWVIRGTPLLVQAFFIYFGIPQLLGIRMTADVAGIITLSLNAGAYLSEIFRGGIQAVHIGQMEAARSLGMPYGRAMAKVVLPQAIRIVVPSAVNQFIITLKDTSILSVIGMNELTKTGKTIVAANLESFKTWSIVALYYLVLISLLTFIMNKLERSLSNGKKSSN